MVRPGDAVVDSIFFARNIGAFVAPANLKSVGDLEGVGDVDDTVERFDGSLCDVSCHTWLEQLTRVAIAGSRLDPLDDRMSLVRRVFFVGLGISLWFCFL